MKAHITTAVLVLATVPAFAQSAGVSHPDQSVITSTDDSAAQQTVRRPLTPADKPSAAVATPAATPQAAPAPADVVYGPYVPYKGAVVASSNASATPREDDLDSMIVTSVPEREGELREGTLLQTRIKEALSTQSTVKGTRFTAEVTEPIERHGRVIIPVGAVLEGMVTQVHGGHRISGAAALHLETRDILLPDGTHYIVHAQLVDTGKSGFRIDDEGTLKRKGDTKQDLAVIGGVTGAGAVTGAVIGGGVGAVVGAGIGAGVSTVIWLKEDRQATLPKDVQLVFSLTTPMILTPLSNAALGAVEGSGAAQ